MELLVKSHKDISSNFHNILCNYKDCNLNYMLLDNNIAIGELPILVEEGDLSRRTIKVHDLAKLEEFIGKRNVGAENSANEEQSITREKSSIITLLRMLKSDGFTVITKEHDNNRLIRKTESLSIRETLENRNETSSPTSVIMTNRPQNIKRCKSNKSK